jgi:hypothetical protein
MERDRMAAPWAHARHASRVMRATFAHLAFRVLDLSSWGRFVFVGAK